MNRLTQLVLHLPVRDSSGAFRAYRASKLRDVQLDRVQARGYAYLEEMLCRLQQASATFTEVPIVFHQRRAGASKINVAEAIGKFRTLSRLAIRPKRPRG
jgi:dolichol-phosphate mannosyltransferase